MVNKSNTAEATAEVAEKEATAEVEQAKRVRVKLPRNPGHNANQDEFYSVNGKNYIIKRGEYVEVPPELEEVIRNGEKAEEAAWEYAEAQKLREA